MGTYAVTGSASGMGRAAAEKLRAGGHVVISVDRVQADVVADLSCAQGRQTAAHEVLAATAGVLDGAVLAAGLGPGGSGPDRLKALVQVNFLGVTELLTAWHPALACADGAKVVVFPATRRRRCRWCRPVRCARSSTTTQTEPCAQFGCTVGTRR